MKSIFAAALIAALAAAEEIATDDSAMSSNSTSEDAPSDMPDMFVLNDEGRMELNEEYAQYLPANIPEISFSAEDPAPAAEKWMADYVAANAALESELMGHWQDYQNQVAKPWNDFIDNAWAVKREKDNVDITAYSDAIRQIMKNTYIEGETAYNKFPEIEDFFKQVRDACTKQCESMDISKVKVPVSMRMVSRDTFALHHTLQYEMDDGSMMDYDNMYGADSATWTPTEESYEPSKFEQAMEEFSKKAEDAFISWGFDEAKVNQWLNDAGAAWEDMGREQDIANTKLAQQQVKEASDYMKGVLEKASNDLESKAYEAHSEWEKDLTAKISQMKNDLDQQAKQNYDAFDQWIADTYQSAQDFANADAEAMIDDQYDAVGFAQAAAEEESSSNYGYGIAAAGVALAAAAYLYNKKRQADVKPKESFLSEDADFVLV